ncbi:MAG: hypothetical protein ACI4KA_07090 [Oscillospiraceae bacterium]
MGKLKFLLALFMGTLVFFAAQRTYIAKTDTLGEIYSDIIFTQLAVETQQYTRQIEYGLENGKSLENFYNVQTILSGVKRCYSYINGAYIVSADHRLLYSNTEKENAALSSISIGDFENGEVYSVHSNYENYFLTMPIYGREKALSGYLVLSVDNRAINNTLSAIYKEYELQAVVLAVLMFMIGSIAIIHICKNSDKLFRSSLGIITASVCSYIAVDGAISTYKLLITIESIIQQSISKINLSLQNDLDTVQQKGVSIGRIVDFNSWLFESGKSIPFIENITYDKNYKITAAVSQDYINTQIWRYAVVILTLLLVFAAVGIVLQFVIGQTEYYFVKRKRVNAKESIVKNADM